MNPLVELQKFGQSFWYDNIRRGLIVSGELKRMIEQDGLRGMTSNPTIFEKAIGGSQDYDAAIRALVARGLSVPEIYEELSVGDIQAATDAFRPLFDREKGNDGYVCLEVSPKLAHDTQQTIAEAERLWKKVARPNVMIKVPATPEGIPAIEHLIGAGLNINVTLMFGMGTYERVAEAYIRGLEKLAREGKDVTRTASVASLFVSRVDTLVDKLLEKAGAPEDLHGTAAIANSRLLYQRYKQIFHGPRFAELRATGARAQRLLWASTSTKNPKYGDVLYAEALIGPETVDTMPDVTIAAFRDHGKARPTLEEGVEDAQHMLERLAQAGLHMDAVMRQLQDEGVRLFAESFDKLMQTLAEKREALLKQTGARAAGGGWHPDPLDDAAGSRVRQMLADGPARLWKRDATLWKDDPAVGEKIRNRLGWLDSPQTMRRELDAIREFASKVKEAGFTNGLLLGMGGSSLCPEVCRNTYGVASGYPDLRVVDTTDPGAIAARERAADLSRTLFINASKSGTTIESASLGRYFWEKAPRGEQWVAITDAGTVLDQEGTQRHFRRVFRNAADIGGRYAALSFFGLVPASAIGVDVGALLDRADEAVRSNAAGEQAAAMPGIGLGATLGELAMQGRDKLTFVLSPRIADFGNWVEQLIAESTGKEGKGVIPVVGEPLAAPLLYGNDRAFVFMLMENEYDPDAGHQIEGLQAAGHPVYSIKLRDTLDLGGEFFRWEVATAVCGAMLKINPFDEPNVTESKENTARLLKHFEAEGRLPEETSERPGDLARLLEKAGPGDYISLLAFIDSRPEHVSQLQAIRARLRDTTRLATTLGFGPRYLHSTGQLHKGGPDKGLFVLLTADDREDLPIPGQRYTFGVLKQAQALGDLEALRRRGRRVIHIHLGKDVAGGLEELSNALAAQTRAAD